MILIHLALAASIAPSHPIQVTDAVRFALSEGRRSDRQKLMLAHAVRTNVAYATVARKERTEKRVKRNSEVQVLVAKAPKGGRSVGKAVKPAKGKILERTDVVTTYVADVRLTIQNEKLVPVEGSIVEVTGGSEVKDVRTHSPFGVFGSASAWGRASGLGYLKVFEAKVPGMLKLKVANSATNEWSLLGGEQYIPVTIPATEVNAVRTWDKKQPRKFLYYLNKSNVKTTDKSKAVMAVYEANVQRRISVEPNEPVVVRREVADFSIRMPQRSMPVRAFISDRPIDAPTEGEEIRFKARRDEIGDGDATIVLQAETENGGFGCSLKVKQPNFYETNRLEAKLLLESIPSGRIQLAGKTVDESFPLSPIHWRSSAGSLLASIHGGAQGQRPMLVTGAQALELLGVDKKKIREQEPGPNKQKRYGKWLWIDSMGLGLHCRYDHDGKKAWKPNMPPKPGATIEGKFLPHEDLHGLLESIRVTTPQGGQIGTALFVGASRENVVAAFGEPDTFALSARLADIGLSTPEQRNKGIMGDAKLECWDETYLGGGLRIKWDGDRVKWFEIARPIQLLFNGTRAFDPPEVETIALQSARSEIPAYQSRFEADLLSILDKASGLRHIYDLDAAEVTATATLDAEVGDPVAARHFYVVSYKENGKTKYRNVSESFLCYERTIRGRFDVTLKDRSEQSVTVPYTPVNTLGHVGGHVKGRQCSYNVNDEMTRMLFARGGNGTDPLMRAVTNACTTFSDMAGTVVGVNWDAGLLLINLGRQHGIRSKADGEMTELNMYLLHEVDPKTGAGGARNEISHEQIMGRPLFKEWLEVQTVGDDWCIAQPKKKEDHTNKTQTAWEVLPRVLEPDSGLVRVTISKKSGG